MIPRADWAYIFRSLRTDTDTPRCIDSKAEQCKVDVFPTRRAFERTVSLGYIPSVQRVADSLICPEGLPNISEVTKHGCLPCLSKPVKTPFGARKKRLQMTGIAGNLRPIHEPSTTSLFVSLVSRVADL